MYEPNEEDIEKQKSILEEEREPFIVRFYFNNKSTLYGFVAYGRTGINQYGLNIIAAGVSALV